MTRSFWRGVKGQFAQSAAPGTITPGGFDFNQGIVSENNAPKITARKGGQLVLTSGAVDMLGDDIEFAQLAYNRAKGIIGIRGADENAQGHYRLRTQKNDGSRVGHRQAIL